MGRVADSECGVKPVLTLDLGFNEPLLFANRIPEHGPTLRNRAGPHHFCSMRDRNQWLTRPVQSGSKFCFGEHVLLAQVRKPIVVNMSSVEAGAEAAAGAAALPR